MRHSQFINSQVTGECNDGAIVARSVGIQDGCYTSVLTIDIGQEMTNQTIECVYYNNFIQTGDSTIIIGQTMLKISGGITILL